MPALSAPSPIPAITLDDLFASLFASAMPSAEDIDVELLMRLLPETIIRQL